MANVGRYVFVVQPRDVDHTARIRLNALGDYLLYSANLNATENGFGLEALQSKGLAWVLSRLEVCFTERLTTNETFIVETWVETIQRVATERKFLIYDAKETIIGFASSHWAVIDINNRRLVDINEADRMAPFIVRDHKPIPPARKIHTKETFPLLSHTVAYSDLDINQHASSMKYLQWILDATARQANALTGFYGFSMNFAKECRFGETVQLRADTSGTYFEVQNEENKTCCRIVLLGIGTNIEEK